MPYTQTELMDWVNQQVSPSPYNIIVTNLTTCFHDGITLCAILHSYYPEPIPFEQLLPSCKKFNIELAFTEAENVGIPPSMNATDIWLTRSPDKEKMIELMTLWRRYLEMEDDEVKADLGEKCDVLKAKYNEMAQRNQGYQGEIKQVIEDYKNSSKYAQCKRCGDCIFLEDGDKFVKMESVTFHEECHRCYNCSTIPESKGFEWYQNEIWCQSCKSLSEEQLGSGAATAELETRLLEIKQIEQVRKDKGSSPFREMERKREEERRRKMEAYKKSQLERAQSASKEQEPEQPSEEASAEQKKREREIEEKKIQEREEGRARRQAEEDALRQRVADEKRLRAEAVRAEEVNFDELKSRRGAELEEIKAKRAGVNPFREMERQAQEARKKKFARFATGTKGEEVKAEKQETQGTVRNLSKSRPVSTNPFAEMEKKRQQEKLARLKKYASIGRNVGADFLKQAAAEQEQVSTPVTPVPDTLSEKVEESAPTPVTESPKSPESATPAPTTPVDPAPINTVSPTSPITPEKNEETPPSEVEAMATPEAKKLENTEETKNALSDLLAAVEGLPEEAIPQETIDEIYDEVKENFEKEEEARRLQGACEELLDISQEVELLNEAAEIVEAQRGTIQEQLTVIREQEELLAKQKEAIVLLERELAALKGTAA